MKELVSNRKLRVSIIVPVYNVENYIEKCLDSVVEQLTEEMELIIVNDGSTDSSRLICEKYKEQCSGVVVVDKKNGGLSSARNVGIELARGEYLFFLDSDDWISEDALLYLCECAIKNSADIVIGEHLRVSTEQTVRPSKEAVYEQIDKEYAMKMILQTGVNAQEKYVMCCNKLFHRKLWEELRFPIGHYHEDEYVIHHLYHKADKILLTDKVTYYYRTREDSITGNLQYNPTKYQDFIGFSKSRLEFIKENYSSLNVEALRFYLENITIQFLLFGAGCEASKSLSREAKRMIAKEMYRNLRYIHWKRFMKYNIFLLSTKLYLRICWK